jgi:hypothetical protein
VITVNTLIPSDRPGDLQGAPTPTRERQRVHPVFGALAALACVDAGGSDSRQCAIIQFIQCFSPEPAFNIGRAWEALSMAAPPVCLSLYPLWPSLGISPVIGRQLISTDAIKLKVIHRT